MSALVRVARSRAEVEWDEWWLKAAAWHIKPWWKRLFTRCPRCPRSADWRADLW